MGLFDFFKNDIVIQDEVFGRLKLIKGKTNNFFFGKQIFVPIENEITIHIATNNDAISNQQREFYLELQINYEEYKTKMIPIIEDTFQNAIENFKISNFDKEFKLIAVLVPDYSEKLLVWNLSFESRHEENHLFTIDFNDYEPIDLQIDG